ncbi:MAG: NAD(P)H-binding protein [Actinomycetes bacterium]
MHRPGSASHLRAEGIDAAHGDMADPSSLARAVAGCDAVAHFAGILGDEAVPRARFMAVNAEGTKSLPDAAAAGVRRIAGAKRAGGSASSHRSASTTGWRRYASGPPARGSCSSARATPGSRRSYDRARTPAPEGSTIAVPCRAAREKG